MIYHQRRREDELRVFLADRADEGSDALRRHPLIVTGELLRSGMPERQ